MENEWLMIDTSYACGVVVVADGVVIDAAPIFRKWAIGLTETELRKRVKVIDSIPHWRLVNPEEVK